MPKGLVAGALVSAPLIGVGVGLAVARLGVSGRLGAVISVVASVIPCGAGFYALGFLALS
jgi:hypothetical protein